MIRVTIPGEPVAQGRGRIVKVGGFSRIADPKKSRDWKATAQIHMLEARERWKVPEPLTVPLEVHIAAFWICPKSSERKMKPRPQEWRAKKPDIDNIIKAVLDAGNGVLWQDDNLVVRVIGEKFQAPQGGSPRIEVTVQAIEA
jgi:Holliday junction resolvase RusA-like endonuclease